MMFDSSRPLAAFDQLRVPYRVVEDSRATATPAYGLEWLRPSDGRDTGLYWPNLSPEGQLASVSSPPRLLRLGSHTVYASLLPGEVLAEQLKRVGGAGRWEAAEPVGDASGRPVAAILRGPEGGIALPFDPNEVVRSFWAEEYGAGDGSAARLRSAAVYSYYRLRPLLPRRLQIALRRAYSRVQARSSFPAWPVEESLHGFYDTMLGFAAAVAGRSVPWISPWPGAYEWALVLTHDVETAEGVRLLSVLRDLEAARGYVSSWNFVPKRYSVPPALVAQLDSSGCEVGVHGLYHDGRDLESARMLAERLPAMRHYAEQWGAVGFRSPATQREWGLIATLPFEYDSSYPDTDPFEPQKGGCCSWWPLFNGEVVELPITLAQDHTVFVILRRQDDQVWTDKAEVVRARGGMALIITHPDYVGLGPIADAYDSLLARYADDPTVWRALPRDVSRWWRRRADSRLAATSGGWEVVGPAAGEATVRWTGTPQEAGRSASSTPR